MAQRVLIRAPNWLGDVILSLGAVRDLRRAFPEARIEVLARPSVAEIYRAVTQVDGVQLSTGSVRGDAASLRGAFDLAVLLPNSFASALAVWLARVPERWGYATDGRHLLLTRAARIPGAVRGESEVYYYRAMLAGVGLTVSASPDTSLECPADWRERGQAILGEPGFWVGVSAGAAFGSAKRWMPQRWAAVADQLARRAGCRVAILGSAAERELGMTIAEAMQTPARVLCGETTLAELTGLLASLRLLLTNDSGPMHVASALGIPLVAVFGPTDWRETAPRGAHACVVHEPVPCAPCKLRDCPIDHDCMRRVSVEQVTEQALALIESHA